MILPITAFGNSVLRAETKEINPTEKSTQKLILNMFETMYAANGAGLAAPQIGKTIRLFIVDGTGMADRDDAEPELDGYKKAFINPIIHRQFGEEWAFEEGCLSIPDVREKIIRPDTIEIEYFDENGEKHHEEINGIRARIIQHEYDHIEGVLFTDYVKGLRRQFIKNKLKNIHRGNFELSYPMRLANKKLVLPV